MGVAKWREPIIEPFSIPLSNNIKLLSIDGYPHAGNDVFECKGTKDGQPIKFYLKVARQLGADIENEINALSILNNLNIPVPKVIDNNVNFQHPFIVTSEVDGERLSTILYRYDEEEIPIKSLESMPKFGESLAKIHLLNLDWNYVKPRKVHFIPDIEYLKRYDLKEIGKWLIENEPAEKKITFIHGDHHYANILWKDGNISAVLDWELCGRGWKEFDIAWALIVRPSQRFMKTKEEQEEFLDGYGRYSSFDRKALNYCMVLIYLHFYGIGKASNDDAYTDFVLKEIERIKRLQRR